MASHIRDLTRMNPPVFYGSEVEEDTQQFIIEIYKIIYAMGFSTSEKSELDTYQLKYMSQVWDARVSNPKSMKGRDTILPNKKLTCAKCGKCHLGECLVGTDIFIGCGKSDHKVRDFHYVKTQEKGSSQVQTSGSNEAPKKNHFNAIRSRGE
ncbi:hypothetical protein EJD97_018350 [Solanum chilense]|uniref:Gag-pol polyprotein n=1 Tax=Solanum chilense TaxID=4083 RepID=A0A6N2CEB6_SOLCI|nr:hypothetical protein EJD97_018350 [Solanum chilense]